MGCPPRVPLRIAPFVISLVFFSSSDDGPRRGQGGRRWLERVWNRPGIDRLTVAANERRERLQGKASPLQLQDVHSRFGVGLDICDPADLPARKKSCVDPPPGGEQLPGLLADSEAGTDAPSLHTAGLPQPPKGALRRLVRAGL